MVLRLLRFDRELSERIEAFLYKDCWCDMVSAHDHVVFAALFEEGANVSDHDVRTRELESARSPAKKINLPADQ